MHLVLFLTGITTLKCVFRATMVSSENVQGMAEERSFTWEGWQIFSQKALKDGNILQKLLGLQSDTEFCRHRNWNLSAHESKLLSQEQTCIRHACGTAEQNLNAINFFSLSTTIIAQIIMLRTSDPVLSFSVDNPI